MPADSIFCSECGSPNAPDAAFCESCGQSLDAAQPASAAAAGPPVPPAARPGRKISARMLALAGVIILVAAIYLVNSRTRTPSSAGSLGASDSAGEAVSDTTPAGDSLIFIQPGRELHPPASGGSAIASGAVLTLRSRDQVCSSTSSAGDQFSAQVERAVSGRNGARIPRGTAVTLVVDRAAGGELIVSVQSIDLGNTTYLLMASVDSVELSGGDGLPPMPPLPSGIPPGAVVTRAPGGGSGDRCIEPNALIRVTLQEELLLGAP